MRKLRNISRKIIQAYLTSCQGLEGISVCVLSRARGLRGAGGLAFASRFVSVLSETGAARWRPCQLVVMLLIGLQQFIGARGDCQVVIPGK